MLRLCLWVTLARALALITKADLRPASNMANPPVTFQLPTDEPAVLFSGYPPFPVTDVNDLWLHVCGFSTREEIVGQTMRIIQGPETERDRVDGLMTHVRRRQPFSTVLTNYTKTRQPFRNELRVEPVDSSDGLRGPNLLARSRISLLTKKRLRVPKLVTTRVSRLAAQSQCTISAGAGKSRQIPITQKSAPMKSTVPMPSTLASPFFQPKEIEQKEIDSMVRLAAVERYGSYWRNLVLGCLVGSQIDRAFFYRRFKGKRKRMAQRGRQQCRVRQLIARDRPRAGGRFTRRAEQTDEVGQNVEEPGQKMEPEQEAEAE
jgi:hypothetical protein